MTLLKVSSKSNPNAVAGAFAGVIREAGQVEVCVIGAGAVNQAVKAAAIARTYLWEQGIELVCVPSFVELNVDGRRRTGIRLVMTGCEPGAVPTHVDGNRAREDGHRVHQDGNGVDGDDHREIDLTAFGKSRPLPG